MASSLKSNSKLTAKKAVVGKSKKKTVWWKKLYLGSAVFLLLGTVGFSGYTWWQQRQLKARAAGWTQITYVNGAILLACKIDYGSSWGVWWIVANGTPYGMTAYPKLTMNSQSNVVASTSIGAYPNTYSGIRTLFVSKSPGAGYDGKLSGWGSGSGAGPVSALANC